MSEPLRRGLEALVVEWEREAAGHDGAWEYARHRDTSAATAVAAMGEVVGSHLNDIRTLLATDDAAPAAGRMVAVAYDDIDVKAGAVLTVRVDPDTGRMTVHHKLEPKETPT